MDPVDVRSPETVSRFENMLAAGPMTIVLVYADWCGHCTTFKENIWSKLIGLPNRKVNLASVHYDQLQNTSQKNASIKGYPSVLVIGSDKKAATFPDGSKKTNAFPRARELEVMEEMATKDANKILTAPKFVEDIVNRKPAQLGGGDDAAPRERRGGLLNALTQYLGNGGGSGAAASRRNRKRTAKRSQRNRRRTHRKKLMARRST